MNDPNTKNLAETLAKTGLAASATEAAKMAQNIMGTDKKVSEHFNEKNAEIDENLTKKKMSYKEEIDDLIRKTSPEHKDYHIPVKGFTRDVKVNAEVQTTKTIVQEPVQKVNTAPVEQPRSVQEPQVQPIKPPEVKPVQPPQEASPQEPLPEKKPEVKEVYTDSIQDDDRTLQEIMHEDAKRVYSNAKVEIKQEREPEEIKHELDELEEEESNDDFILGESEPQQEPQQVENEPDQVQQPEEEEKKEFENPIDDVDLMDYFKFN